MKTRSFTLYSSHEEHCKYCHAPADSRRSSLDSLVSNDETSSTFGTCVFLAEPTRTRAHEGAGSWAESRLLSLVRSPQHTPEMMIADHLESCVSLCIKMPPDPIADERMGLVGYGKLKAYLLRQGVAPSEIEYDSTRFALVERALENGISLEPLFEEAAVAEAARKPAKPGVERAKPARKKAEGESSTQEDGAPQQAAAQPEEDAAAQEKEAAALAAAKLEEERKAYAALLAEGEAAEKAKAEAAAKLAAAKQAAAAALAAAEAAAEAARPFAKTLSPVKATPPPGMTWADMPTPTPLKMGTASPGGPAPPSAAVEGKAEPASVPAPAATAATGPPKGALLAAAAEEAMVTTTATAIAEAKPTGSPPSEVPPQKVEAGGPSATPRPVARMSRASVRRGSLLRSPLDVKRDREAALDRLRDAFDFWLVLEKEGLDAPGTSLSASQVARMLTSMLQASDRGALEPTSESDALDFIVDNEGEGATALTYDGFVKGLMALVSGEDAEHVADGVNLKPLLDTVDAVEAAVTLAGATSSASE